MWDHGLQILRLQLRLRSGWHDSEGGPERGPGDTTKEAPLGRVPELSLSSDLDKLRFRWSLIPNIEVRGFDPLTEVLAGFEAGFEHACGQQSAMDR